MCNSHWAIAGSSALTLKTITTYRGNLRKQVRNYWNGTTTRPRFISGMKTAIEIGFKDAWRVGAAECGRRFESFTAAQLRMVQELIDNAVSFVPDFATSIIRKSDGGKLDEAYSKIELWVNRFNEIRDRAKAEFCGDKLLEWVIGVAEHCPSCLRLNGIVKPASFWHEQEILPAVPGATYLECKGYKCKCTLKRTSKPETKGKLPSLP